MDIKSAFLNRYIIEEVYVKQPQGFENYDFQKYTNCSTCALNLSYLLSIKMQKIGGAYIFKF